MGGDSEPVSAGVATSRARCRGGGDVQLRFFHDDMIGGRAKSVGRKEDTNHISHDRSPTPFKPLKKIVFQEEHAGSAGMKCTGRLAHGYLCGHGDMLHTTGKKIN